MEAWKNRRKKRAYSATERVSTGAIAIAITVIEQSDHREVHSTDVRPCAHLPELALAIWGSGSEPVTKNSRGGPHHAQTSHLSMAWRCRNDFSQSSSDLRAHLPSLEGVAGVCRHLTAKAPSRSHPRPPASCIPSLSPTKRHISPPSVVHPTQRGSKPTPKHHQKTAGPITLRVLPRLPSHPSAPKPSPNRRATRQSSPTSRAFNRRTVPTPSASSSPSPDTIKARPAPPAPVQSFRRHSSAKTWFNARTSPDAVSKFFLLPPRSKSFLQLTLRLLLPARF